VAKIKATKLSLSNIWILVKYMGTFLFCQARHKWTFGAHERVQKSPVLFESLKMQDKVLSSISSICISHLTFLGFRVYSIVYFSCLELFYWEQIGFGYKYRLRQEFCEYGDLIIECCLFGGSFYLFPLSL